MNEFDVYKYHYNIRLNKCFFLVYLLGSVIIPGAFFGIIMGGFLMKRLHLDVPGIAKMLVFTNLIPTVAVITLLFLGCQNIDLAGITSAYSIG
jgi:hypothetical protein